MSRKGNKNKKQTHRDIQFINVKKKREEDNYYRLQIFIYHITSTPNHAVQFRLNYTKKTKN